MFCAKRNLKFEKKDRTKIRGSISITKWIKFRLISKCIKWKRIFKFFYLHGRKVTEINYFGDKNKEN